MLFNPFDPDYVADFFGSITIEAADLFANDTVSDGTDCIGVDTPENTKGVITGDGCTIDTISAGRGSEGGLIDTCVIVADEDDRETSTSRESSRDNTYNNTIGGKTIHTSG